MSKGKGNFQHILEYGIWEDGYFLQAPKCQDTETQRSVSQHYDRKVRHPLGRDCNFMTQSQMVRPKHSAKTEICTCVTVRGVWRILSRLFRFSRIRNQALPRWWSKLWATLNKALYAWTFLDDSTWLLSAPSNPFEEFLLTNSAFPTGLSTVKGFQSSHRVLKHVTNVFFQSSANISTLRKSLCDHSFYRYAVKWQRTRVSYSDSRVQFRKSEGNSARRPSRADKFSLQHCCPKVSTANFSVYTVRFLGFWTTFVDSLVERIHCLW